MKMSYPSIGIKITVKRPEEFGLPKKYVDFLKSFETEKR